MRATRVLSLLLALTALGGCTHRTRGQLRSDPLPLMSFQEVFSRSPHSSLEPSDEALVQANLYALDARRSLYAENCSGAVYWFDAARSISAKFPDAEDSDRLFRTCGTPRLPDERSVAEADGAPAPSRSEVQ